MPRTLYFTFGNHMHWVDMEWLWGYDVLSGSTRDLLRLIGETGAKGCVNFDAVGYEKLAAECPEALGELRAAVADGRVEVVGASYGQPYGLFHGGESNVRQRVFGIRATLRTLGVRPRGFWEEEFDFCPQLPQILAGCGFTAACLFFQWTWHTPEMPKEEASLVLWEGMDGTRLPTLPRNDLNLHQWPEDFDEILESPLIEKLAAPALVQWVELLPSKDWMCRSEVLLPRLQDLLGDPRFRVVPATLSEVVAALSKNEAPVRRYTLDDVWHGVSVGKNADRHPRRSLEAERALLRAEALAATTSLLGRPYPRWDIYPVWELEEGWRQLLAFEHHDNHECEGLCGDIGASLMGTERLAAGVIERSLRALLVRAGAAGSAPPVRPGEERLLAFNPLGWTRPVPAPGGTVVPDVPAFGFRVVEPSALAAPDAVVTHDDGVFRHLRAGTTSCRLDLARGTVRDLENANAPSAPAGPGLGALAIARDGQRLAFVPDELESSGGTLSLLAADGSRIVARYLPEADSGGVRIELDYDRIRTLDPGMNGGLRMTFPAPTKPFTVIHDHPYGVSAIRAEGSFRRKYPTGDWMTSPQYFETVARPFTSLSMVDLCDAETGTGLLIAHAGHPSWFRTDEGVELCLTTRDPWDEEHHAVGGRTTLWLWPHGMMSPVEKVRWVRERLEPGVVRAFRPDGAAERVLSFAGLQVNARSTLATALFRESEDAGRGLDRHAGAGMGFPFVVRLVEWNGEEDEVLLACPGRMMRAMKTNLLGEPEAELAPETCPPPIASDVPGWSGVRVRLRPHEIATLYLDLELGRKVARDLDAHRSVWATVHKEKR